MKLRITILEYSYEIENKQSDNDIQEWLQLLLCYYRESTVILFLLSEVKQVTCHLVLVIIRDRQPKPSLHESNKNRNPRTWTFLSLPDCDKTFNVDAIWTFISSFVSIRPQLSRTAIPDSSSLVLSFSFSKKPNRMLSKVAQSSAATFVLLFMTLLSSLDPFSFHSSPWSRSSVQIYIIDRWRWEMLSIWQWTKRWQETPKYFSWVRKRTLAFND